MPQKLLFTIAACLFISRLGAEGDNGASKSEPLPPVLVKAAEDHPATEPLPMEKVTVQGTRQSSFQKESLEKAINPETTPPSVENGAMVHKKIGNRDVQVGAAKWNDVMEKDARFRDKHPMVRIDFLRMAF